MYLSEEKVISLKEAEEKGIIEICEYSYKNDDSFEETHYIYVLKENDAYGKIGGLLIGDGYYGHYSFPYVSYEQKIEELKNKIC